MSMFPFGVGRSAIRVSYTLRLLLGKIARCNPYKALEAVREMALIHKTHILRHLRNGESLAQQFLAVFDSQIELIIVWG